MNATLAVGLEQRQLRITSRTTLNKGIANPEVADGTNAHFRFQLFNEREILAFHRRHDPSNNNL